MTNLIEAIQNLYEIASNTFEQLRLNPDCSVDHMAAGFLYGRILETMTSCIVLLQAERDFSIPLIIRPSLDAYVDLILLANDPDYVKNMRANELKEKNKLLSKSIKGGEDNEFLNDIGKMDSAPRMLQEGIDELRKLREEGRIPLRADERFDMAGLKNLYPSVFARLSGHIHNDMSILKFRYLHLEKDGFKIKHSRKLSENELCLYLDTICMICAAGLQTIYKILGIEENTKLIETVSALGKVRLNW